MARCRQWLQHGKRGGMSQRACAGVERCRLQAVGRGTHADAVAHDVWDQNQEVRRQGCSTLQLPTHMPPAPPTQPNPLPAVDRLYATVKLQQADDGGGGGGGGGGDGLLSQLNTTDRAALQRWVWVSRCSWGPQEMGAVLCGWRLAATLSRPHPHDIVAAAAATRQQAVTWSSAARCCRPSKRRWWRSGGGRRAGCRSACRSCWSCRWGGLWVSEGRLWMCAVGARRVECRLCPTCLYPLSPSCRPPQVSEVAPASLVDGRPGGRDAWVPRVAHIRWAGAAAATARGLPALPAQQRPDQGACHPHLARAAATACHPRQLPHCRRIAAIAARPATEPLPPPCPPAASGGAALKTCSAKWRRAACIACQPCCQTARAAGERGGRQGRAGGSVWGGGRGLAPPTGAPRPTSHTPVPLQPPNPCSRAGCLELKATKHTRWTAYAPGAEALPPQLAARPRVSRSARALRMHGCCGAAALGALQGACALEPSAPLQPRPDTPAAPALHPPPAQPRLHVGVSGLGGGLVGSTFDYTGVLLGMSPRHPGAAVP